MKSIWGRAPQYAHAITDGVLVHARRLRRQVGTDDLFLLAVAGLTEDAGARRALEAEGLTEERLLGEVRADADGEGPFEFLTWAPACYILQGGAGPGGRARGRADHPRAPPDRAALGPDEPHVAHPLASRGPAGADPAATCGRLGCRFPPPPPSPAGDRVGRAGMVRARRRQAGPRPVRLRLSPGARWGFNHEDDRAWVNAEAGVDLEALVRDALAG